MPGSVRAVKVNKESQSDVDLRRTRKERTIQFSDSRTVC
jgi:hypothetical protein